MSSLDSSPWSPLGFEGHSSVPGRRRAIPPVAMPLPNALGPATKSLPAVLEPIRDALDRVGACYEEILADVSWRTRDMTSQAARFSGKRLRPGLTCIASRIAGGGVGADVATVAAIVELIHTATLVHDDVLDGADVRRKVATVNARWGDGIAVLVGDVLFSKAYLAAACLGDRFASRYLSEVVGEILEGEIHQDVVSRDPNLAEDEYRAIIRGKTAALYEAALVVGAHYGGAPEMGGPLGRYGHHLGMAFQIVDDRLDLTGDEATMGKTLGRDLGEGKTTLPVILWLRERPDSERRAAISMVETAWDDAAAADRLRRRLAQEGALAAADAAARAEVELALTSLEGVPPGPDRDLLERIARYVLGRHQ